MRRSTAHPSSSAGIISFSDGFSFQEVLEFHDFSPPLSHFPVLILTQRRLRRGLGGCWEVGFAIYSRFLARFQFEERQSDRGGGSGVTPFGLPTVLRFAQFRVIGISMPLIGLQVHRETAQIAKGWPSFRTSLTRSRSFSICNSQPDARVPSASRHNQ